MFRRTRLLQTTLIALTLTGSSGRIAPVRAAGALSAEQIVADTDRAMTRARDQYFEYDLITYEPGKDPRVLKFQVHIQGDKHRRIEFTAPGDVKGMRFLVLDVDQMYVYMPAYKKVRRVASHVKSQGFMGSAYTQDAMSLTKFGDVFSPRLLGEDAESWQVELTKRPEKAYSYPKLVVRIRKDIHQPIAVEYYNEKDQKVRSEVREGFQCKDQMCNPRKMTMTDHTRGDLKSVMVQRAWKANTGIDEREFTVRALQRRH
jgi:hypothetical protein